MISRVMSGAMIKIGQFADAQKTLEGIAAQFSAKHPNVTIKLSSGGSTTDDLLQKLSAGFAADVYPDVSYAFGSWASQLADSGRTLDITGNIADPAVKWDDFPEAARETAAPGGRTIGFPAIVDNLALFYNTTLFDAAGLAYPTKDWTWDDFRAAAKKLTNPAKNVYGTGFDVSAGEGTTWSMWPQLWQNGGSILSADEKTSAFNSAAGVAAVSYWRDLAQTDKSVRVWGEAVPLALAPGRGFDEPAPPNWLPVLRALRVVHRGVERLSPAAAALRAFRERTGWTGAPVIETVHGVGYRCG